MSNSTIFVSSNFVIRGNDNIPNCYNDTCLINNSFNYMIARKSCWILLLETEFLIIIMKTFCNGCTNRSIVNIFFFFLITFERIEVLMHPNLSGRLYYTFIHTASKAFSIELGVKRQLKVFHWSKISATDNLRTKICKLFFLWRC